MYCVKSRGKVWLILDPKGTTIDEASHEEEAMGIADGYVSQCLASRSGYGNKGGGDVTKVKFSHKEGDFKW
jgi:hypothetical protein